MKLFTTEDTAVLLIDHLVGTMKLVKNIDHGLLPRNVRALAPLAVATDMPLVSTSSQEDHFQGSLIDDLKQIAPDAYEARVKRPDMVECRSYADLATRSCRRGTSG